ncbi:IPT/TIG domain-containing protein [Candidatus Giovannonibacteria bacterium]|nr:IPT/TIG domain-containing protein [Candidatus Giovannonibacteria bacterium]
MSAVFVVPAGASSGFVMKEFTLPSGLKVTAIQSVESANFKLPESKIIVAANTGEENPAVTKSFLSSIPYAGFGGGGGGGGERGKSEEAPRPKAFMKVVSPNGGEALAGGSMVTIKWESEQVPQIYIKLRKGEDTYPGPEGMISDFIKNEDFFEWKVPDTLPASKEYSIRVLDKDAPRNDVYDDSDTQFTILSASPFIEAISPSSGPVKTKVMLTGFNFTNDADANDITFWPAEGDGTVFQHIWDVISLDGNTLEFIIPATLLKFSKDYPEGSIEIPVSPGLYNLSLSNTNGKSNIVQFTVSDTSTPSITVLSPNGGEAYLIDQTTKQTTVTVIWSSLGVSRDDLVLLSLIGTRPDTSGFMIDIGKISGEYTNTIFTAGLNDDVLINLSSALGGVSIGQIEFKIRICVNPTTEPTRGERICQAVDDSDAPFSIIDAEPTSPPIPVEPSITVLSPNGGEAFVYGDNLAMTAQVISSKSGGTVSFYLIDESSGYKIELVSGGFSPLKSKEAVAGWPVSKDFAPAGNNYKILVEWKSDDEIEQFSDTSDAPFSIIDALPTEPTPAEPSQIEPSQTP